MRTKMQDLTIPTEGLHGLKLCPPPEEQAQTRNTRSVAETTPGELLPDGSFVDAYGYKHYASGGRYKFSPADKRLTANGAYSGPHSDVQNSNTSEEGLETIGNAALKPRDLQTALLYLSGRSRREIATILEISEQTVTTRLQRADVRAYLTEQKQQYSEDLHALTEMALDVLRDAMDPGEEMKHRLVGADKVLRATERLGSSKLAAKEETATTQLQQVLAAIRGENVTVNIGH